MHGTVASLWDPKLGRSPIFWLWHHDMKQGRMLATLDLLIEPLRWYKSPRHMVASSTLKNSASYMKLMKLCNSPFHSIFHSTLTFHIPVQWLETHGYQAHFWPVPCHQFFCVNVVVIICQKYSFQEWDTSPDVFLTTILLIKQERQLIQTECSLNPFSYNNLKDHHLHRTIANSKLSAMCVH